MNYVPVEIMVVPYALKIDRYFQDLYGKKANNHLLVRIADNSIMSNNKVI